MKTITPNALHSLLSSSSSDLVLIDVRTPLEYDQVHVPQAKSVPLDEFEPKALAESGVIAKDRPVYLLCHSGGRATKCAEKLAKAGLDQAVVIEGGTQAWEAAGLPVIRGSVKIISLERQVRIVAGSLVLLGALLAWFVNPKFVALSGFVGAGLVFAGVTDFCGMGLLLAKLPFNKRKPPA